MVGNYKRIPVMTIAAMLLGGCVTGGQSEQYGSGPIELSYGIQDRFVEYLNDKPAVFAVAEDGRAGYTYYTLCTYCLFRYA